MQWVSKLTLAGSIFLGSLIAAPAPAAPSIPTPMSALPPDAQPLAGADLYSRTLQGVALVVTAKGEGTAWIVDRERRLLFTNAHVAASDKDGSDEVTLIFPEFENGEVIAERTHYLDDLGARAVVGKVVAIDPDRDLALIEAASLPDTAQALPLAQKGVRAGDEVSSIGNPGASQALWVYNKGVVRSVYKEAGERLVETQNPLNPGDSGGPMVNAVGEVVAINVAVSREGSLLSFGIDLSEMNTVLNDYAEGPTPGKNAAPVGKDADAYVARGNAAKAAKQYDKAIAEYTGALKIDPKRLDALKGRAWVYNETSAFEDAVADCTAALQIAPDDLFILRERVYAWQHLERFARVVLDCDHILTIKPDDAGILFHRAQAYEKLDFLDKAHDDYEAAFLNAQAGSELAAKALDKMQEIEEKLKEENSPSQK